MERLWVWANASLISGMPFYCGVCHGGFLEGYSTVHGPMCVMCHDVIARDTTVKLSWDLSTESASFLWVGFDGGKLIRTADETWQASGLIQTKGSTWQDPIWNEALFGWAKKAGYRGPNPFMTSRHDWSYFMLPDVVVPPDPDVSLPA